MLTAPHSLTRAEEDIIMRAEEDINIITSSSSLQAVASASTLLPKMRQGGAVLAAPCAAPIAPHRVRGCVCAVAPPKSSMEVSRLSTAMDITGGMLLKTPRQDELLYPVSQNARTACADHLYFVCSGGNCWPERNSSEQIVNSNGRSIFLDHSTIFSPVSGECVSPRLFTPQHSQR